MSERKFIAELKRRDVYKVAGTTLIPRAREAVRQRPGVNARRPRSFSTDRKLFAARLRNSAKRRFRLDVAEKREIFRS